MTFEDLKGNEKIFSELERAICSGRLSHAYILEGSRSLQKDKIAEAFVSAILCEEKRGIGCGRCRICRKVENGNHEDVFWIRKKGSSIRDEEVAALQDHLRTKPLGERSIAVIEDADTMTIWAKNRLLKTLEEPPSGAVLILLSENVENLLRTIVSRCIVMRLSECGGMEDKELSELAGKTARALISGIPFRELRNLLGDVISDRDRAQLFLDELEIFYGKAAIGEDPESRLYEKEYLYRQAAAIEEARRDLRRPAVIVGYVMKGFLLKSMR